MTVSIVIPCYEGAEYLPETLHSAVNQTEPPLEVLVVDDGSTDDSADIARSFGPPVRVIRQTNQGESAARNRGIAEAQGEYLLFLDADDLLHDQALERLALAVAPDQQSVAAMGCVSYIADPQTPESVQRVEVDTFFPAIISGNIAAIHCWLTPVHLVRKAGGFCDQLCYFEDWDFWCQVALAGGRLVPVDFVGAYYRRHANAQTPSAGKVDRKLGHVAVIERLIAGMLERPELREQHGEAAFWSGWVAMRSARDLGIPWTKLSALASQLEQLLARGPAALRSSRFGRLGRAMGIRWAFRIQSTLRRSASSEEDLMLKKVQGLKNQLVG